MKKRFLPQADTTKPLFLRGWALAVAMSTAFSPVVAAAGTPVFPGLYGRTTIPFDIPAGMLPVRLNSNAINGVAFDSSATNNLTITQTKDKATIDWSSFNIGSGATVRFNQGAYDSSGKWVPNSSYAALNRIYDNNATVIRGKLQADGKVYLINRNGVFFAPDATVQVQSLVASTFNISDANFKDGRLIFENKYDDATQNGVVLDSTKISNEGTITTNYGGSVFMVGPNVENSGTINSPGGKINLVGLKDGGSLLINEVVSSRDISKVNNNDSTDVIYSDTSKAGTVSNIQRVWQDVDAKGNVINVVTPGTLYAGDGGWIGMHGNTVRNDGIIRAVTTRRQNGVIILAGKESVSTGADSITEVSVSDSSEAMARLSINFIPGIVKMCGLSSWTTSFDTSTYQKETLSRIDHEGIILAKSGKVQLEAVDRIFLGSTSSIDVSGYTPLDPQTDSLFNADGTLKDQLNRSMSDQFVDAQLNSVYLRDDYGQKTGKLLGQTVTVDLLKGSAIGNLSSYYLNVAKTARELSTAGGSIFMGAPVRPANSVLSDIVIQKGAKLDISGGYVRYSGAASGSSMLIGADGNLYNISTAPQWMTYTGILGENVTDNGKYGKVTQHGVSFGGHMLSLGTGTTAMADRIVGGDAGSLTLTARVVLNDGDLRADYVTGKYQTSTTDHPISSIYDINKDSDDKSISYLVSLNRGLEATKGGKLIYGNTLAGNLGSDLEYAADAHITTVEVSKAVPPSTQAITQAAVWNGPGVDINTITTISADMISKAVDQNSYARYGLDRTLLDTVKKAGFSSLEINANNTIKTDADVAITLQAGGSYRAAARKIEFLGQLEANGGTATMLIRPTIASYATDANGLPVNNPLLTSLNESIYLGSASSINVAGETVDNSAYGLAVENMQSSAVTAGGSISLTQLSPTGAAGYDLTKNDKANNIIVSEGAVLDVSGGYLINQKGVLAGGNAGSLTVKAPTISLDGTMKGFSQPGKNGGEIILGARSVQVNQQSNPAVALESDGQIPSDMLGKLVIGADKLTESGFSRISLSATDNLTVAEGVKLSPSTVKNAVPNKAVAQGTICNNGTCQLNPDDPLYLDQIGSSYIKLAAGSNVIPDKNSDGINLDPYGNSLYKNLNADLILSKDSAVTALQGGSITITAPNEIDINGTVEAKGGTVSIAAGNMLEINSGALISAKGYNRTYVSTVDGKLPALPLAYSGGTIALSAQDLNVNSGATVDVSGSDPVQGNVQVDKNTVQTVTVAGAAGSLNLVFGDKQNQDGTFGGSLNLDGEIKGWGGAGKGGNTQNGTLTVSSRKTDLLLTAGDVALYQNSGFDALSFLSLSKIIIPANLDISVSRSLTLDSKLIQGSGTTGDTAYVSAPWITLKNSDTQAAASADTAVDTAHGKLVIGSSKPDAVTGQSLSNSSYIDLQGSMLLNGFSDVKLHADKEITFSDRTYTDISTSKSVYKGELNLNAANLTLEANRIYPTTSSAFTVSTPGVVNIQRGTADASTDTTPIYSAGGTLTISAAGGIDHESGVLAAPLGNITLDGGSTGRIYLAKDSIITTAAGASIAYGYYDGSNWYKKYIDTTDSVTKVVTRSGYEYRDINNQIDADKTYVSGAPQKTVTLTGKEVVVREGAVQDLSGGGSVYAANFQAGIPGTVNPLTKAGRYVILPDGSGSRPGPSVYLEAMPELGLKAGYYTLQPAEYAFVPGAIIIQDTGKQLISGQTAVSAEHYHVIAGYMTVRDKAISSQAMKGFSVRLATDVLKEGDFTSFINYSGGNGGNFTLNATAGAVYGGTFNVRNLDGFNPGTVSFSAQNVAVKQNVDNVFSQGFDFNSQLGTTTLLIAAGTISDQGIGTVQLGDKVTTSTVDVESNVAVKADNIILAAKDSITLQSGSTIEAGIGGQVSIVTPAGNLITESGSLLKAGSSISLDLKSSRLDGVMDAGDGGSLSLTANRIRFSNDQTAAPDGTNVVINNDLLGTFAKYGNLTLASHSDMEFAQKTDLTAADKLTLDVARYTGANDASFTAKNITIQNSSAASVVIPATGNANITFKGDAVTVAPRQDSTKGTGNIVFDGFKTVNLDAKNDLVLKGDGTVKTTGDLNLYAARTTTGYDRYKLDSTNNTVYTAASVTLDARGGAVTLNGSSSVDGSAGTGVTPGGSLTILGKTITQTGGKLEVAAGQIGLTASEDINVSGIIAATGSRQVIAKTGEENYYSAGSVTLQSDTGKVALNSGAKIDVSAAGQGDAGLIVLSAKTGVTKNDAAQLAGNAGSNSGDKGGSLTIDSATLTGVGGLDGLSTLTTLSGGGFTNLINIRSRGAEALTLSKVITGREVVVAADGGSITVNGAINADTSDGSGRIELYSGTSLNLNGALSARGLAAGANGGTVILSSQDGFNNTLVANAKAFNGVYALNVNSGSAIDVSGNSGTGGTVSFRAYQGKQQTGDVSLNDVNMAKIAGTINGASRVNVEAVKAYTVNTGNGTITYAADGLSYLKVGNISNYNSFMSAAVNTATKTRLFDSNAYHLQDGIEINAPTNTNIVVDTAFNLSTVRPNGEAAVLTLKSGKNLLVNANISDAPTAIGTLHSNISGNPVTMQNTTAFNLLAGSDGGANYMGVNKGSALTPGKGDLKIANGKWVYTENAPIRFASGNDTILSGTATGSNTMINADMKYNLGSYGGSVRGDVGRDLSMTSIGSAIQTALGNIDIRTGRDIDLGSYVNTGAIRTTGEYTPGTTETMPGSGAFTPSTVSSYWTYQNGGNISLNATGSIKGNLKYDNGWDGAYAIVNAVNKTFFPWYLTAGYGGKENITSGSSVNVTVGIATMAGGNVTAKAGRSLMTQIGTFGKGNLVVSSGGDMNGRFRVMKGNAKLNSGGAFGNGISAQSGLFTIYPNATVFELADARVKVAAQGDVVIGTVLNPDNSREGIYNLTTSNPVKKFWNLTYKPYTYDIPTKTYSGTSFSAASLAGDMTILGADSFKQYNVDTSTLSGRALILPSSFSLSAANDINIGGLNTKSDFIIAPSTDGNLSLVAGGSITGVLGTGVLSRGFIMQDNDISGIYGRQLDTGSQNMSLLSGTVHNGINHSNDDVPVIVSAGKDITNLRLDVSKSAEITADGNISKLYFTGQNNTSDSVTIIKAGGSIDQGVMAQDPVLTNDNTAKRPIIEIGGPGTLLVQAGTRIDDSNGNPVEIVGNLNLGNSQGINSVGSKNNTAFIGDAKNTDSDVIVVVGANNTASMTKSNVKDFFKELASVSNSISKLKDPQSQEAKDLIAATEKDLISKFFYTYAKDKDGKVINPSMANNGNINMVDSSISSRSGSIYALAGSNIYVGKSSLSNSPKSTSGLTTLYGGNLSVYAGNNIEVNESRIMTFYGGDITLWSDQGDINAGRGSKTVVSAPVQIPVTNSKGVLQSITETPPAAGSGIRALTFDTDGEDGPKAAPIQGNVSVYAKGTLDAGEAGIQGNNLTFVATTVLNSQNISFGGTASGVPSQNTNSISIGPMTGSSDATGDKKMLDTIAASGSSDKKKQVAENDDFLMKYLDVKVIDLSEGTL